jgi:hypothetical protein
MTASGTERSTHSGSAPREPTLDQLARFAAVRVIGPYWTDGELQFIACQLSNPDIEAAWRKQHREFQASIEAERDSRGANSQEHPS